MPIELTNWEIEQESREEINDIVCSEYLDAMRSLVYQAIEGLKLANQTDTEIRYLISEIMDDQLE